MKPISMVSVIGGANCSPEESRFADAVGQLLAENGLGIVCGGRGGVMEAVCRGASRVGGFTLGILPDETIEGANTYLSVAIPTGLGEARNVLVILSGKVILAIGGGYGTLSEIAHAVKRGKPVIGFNTWSGRTGRHEELPIDRITTPTEALQKIQSYIVD